MHSRQCTPTLSAIELELGGCSVRRVNRLVLINLVRRNFISSASLNFVEIYKGVVRY
jgi:hypothetical protein